MISFYGRGSPLPAIGLLTLIFLSGCESDQVALSPIEAPAKLQAAEPRVSGAIPSDRGRVPSFEARGAAMTAAVTAPPAVVSGQGGEVTLNFVDTDIREIVHSILGTILKLNYTIDPSVQGTATLDVNSPLPRSALLPTLETLLNQNGATLVQRDGVYRVTPLAGGAAISTIASTGTVGSGSQVLPLRYAAAKDLAKVLEPFVTEGGKITADPARNVLIVTGDAAVRQALVSMIRAFDIDMLAGQSYALFPAGNGDAEKLAGELEKVFRSDGEGPLSGVVRVVPLQRVNAVLVVSAQPRYIEEARRFFGLERRVEDATTRSWHVYYVQNGQSTDLENLLQRAFTPGNVSSAPGPGGLPGGLAPGAEALRMGGGRGGGQGLSALGQAAGIGAAAGAGGPAGAGATGGLGSLTAAAAPREGANPAAEPLAPRTEAGGENENRIRIIANRRNNALLILATQSEYSVIEGMLRKVDIIPLQVLIEATIAEVTLNDELSYGTQFFLGGRVRATLSQASSGQTNTIATIAGNPIGAASDFPGFVLNNGAREVLNALANVTKLRVLSAPQVMVLDNEPARLQVGAQVPVLTQSQQSTIAANAPIVNSVDYRDTGVILVVTPRVNSGGLVTLDISQEVSDVAPSAATQVTSTQNSPTFNERLIRTRVAIQDGQTVGLAGLIRDSDSEENSGVPVLKDIPLLGTLVSSQNNLRMRTELLVLITPHVVKDQRDARALTEDLRNQLINAGLVRQELQRKPLRGSPNPNRF